MALGQNPFVKIEASSGTSTSSALSRTPTAGNTIVVTASAYWASGATPTSLLAVSDSVNGAYTNVGRTITGTTVGAENTLGQFYHLNVAGSGATMTITGGTGTSGVVGLATELTGYTTQTVDVGGNPTATGTGTAVTSAALTNSQANAIYIHSVGSASSANPATFTPTSSFTSYLNETNGSNEPTCDGTYLVVASVASRTATETIDSNRWCSVIGAYSDTPPAGATGYPPLLLAPTVIRLVR